MALHNNDSMNTGAAYGCHQKQLFMLPSLLSPPLFVLLQECHRLYWNLNADLTAAMAAARRLMEPIVEREAERERRRALRLRRVARKLAGAGLGDTGVSGAGGPGEGSLHGYAEAMHASERAAWRREVRELEAEAHVVREAIEGVLSAMQRSRK